jgi:hypothetical protein
MKKEEDNELDFLVDKLTNSIENVVTGDSFQTVVSLASTTDLKSITKKKVGFSIGNLNIINLKEKYIN